MLLVVLEVIYKTKKYSASLSKTTSIVNGVSVAWFLFLTILNRKTQVATWFVCPSLTALSYYYFAFVDYDGSNVSIFYKVIVGISMTFFFLVVLSESWIISTLVYAPFLSYFMWKTGKDMIES